VGRDDDAPLGVADVEEGAVDRGAACDEVLVLLAARGVRERLALLVDARGRRGDVARDAVVRVAAAGHRQVRLAVVALTSDTGRSASASSRRCVCRGVVATVAATVRRRLGLPLLGGSRERRGALCGEARTVRVNLHCRSGHRLGLQRIRGLAGGAHGRREGRVVDLLLNRHEVAPEELLVAGRGLGGGVDHQPLAVRAGEDRLAVLLVEGVARVAAAAGPLLVVVPVDGPQPEARAHQGARELERRG
jgi:hypothetical protein